MKKISKIIFIWHQVLFQALLLAHIFQINGTLSQPVGNLSIKVYRGPNREVKGKSYAPWGYYVKLPADDGPPIPSKSSSIPSSLPPPLPPPPPPLPPRSTSSYTGTFLSSSTRRPHRSYSITPYRYGTTRRRKINLKW
ncbi:uncharacterized protein LOC141854978 [Brevipalpus obovatus]|uniref:uncharacterized protein LOC141854978 n=1 Tax=Brevipalpus obovatus TaxID=246614 RepID=UPI003D9ECCC4